MMNLKTHTTRNFFAAATTSMAILVSSIGLPAMAEDFTARNGGPSSSAMNARSTGAATGLAFVRPVLSGVLYRSGFKGGDKGRTGLSSSQRTELCDNGFSSAFYVDFGKHTKYGSTSCSSGSLDYQATRSSRASISSLTKP